MSWVRTLRTVVLVSIGVGATFGVIALLVGEIGDTGWKIVSTSFLITAAALVAMPSVAAWERDRLGVLPIVGVASTLVGFAWLILGVWAEFDADALWKLPVTLVVVGIATGGIALLQFAKLSPGQHWLLTAAGGAITIVASMVVLAMWAEIDSDAYWRIFGATAVVMTAFLAAIPVLHRSQPTSAQATEFCPVCGAPSTAPEGLKAECPSCGSSYVVDLV